MHGPTAAPALADGLCTLARVVAPCVHNPTPWPSLPGLDAVLTRASACRRRLLGSGAHGVVRIAQNVTTGECAPLLPLTMLHLSPSRVQ